VLKQPDDTVWAGTLMLDGAVTATVLKDVSSSRLSGIRTLVSSTLHMKAPAERLADRAAAYLTAIVIAIAVISGIGWALAGRSGPESLIIAVAVLVVACPCALGLATPLAVSIALGGAARGGVIVRNSAALETGSTVTEVALDKTGTVTLARLAIAAAQPSAPAGSGDAADESQLVCLAAAAERMSEHPLARAIIGACPNPPAARGFRSDRGAGVSAELESDGTSVTVGKVELMPSQPSSQALADAAEHSDRGETVVWVARGDSVVGFIALQDELNPTAGEAVARLRSAGIPVMLLSGDSAETTGAVAGELGVREFSSRLSPEAKAARIETLQRGGARVAMVGDGVNDAPALAQADLSVTVAGGSDVAGETSDIVLARRDLTLLPWLLELSSATRRTIRQNLGWAVAYNVVAVPLAAFGRITPGIAAAAMATSSLLVVGNSLRLRPRIRDLGAETRASAISPPSRVDEELA
jgi:Cu+-exporting ATPase